MKDVVAIVFGTYNRREHLVRAVESVRRCEDAGSYHLYVVDGGSTDGSREWLAAQADVTLVGQRGPLTGAVRAFNLGFLLALDAGHEFIGHLNDDAECLDAGMWARAANYLRADWKAGAVAFKFDLRGPWAHEHVHDGRVYPNFGLWRAQVMRKVSLAHLTNDGRPVDMMMFWNPAYRTYGADSEAGVWTWKLGWTVLKSDDRVHDGYAQDALREGNTVGQKDSELFWRRWPASLSFETGMEGPR